MKEEEHMGGEKPPTEEEGHRAGEGKEEEGRGKRIKKKGRVEVLKDCFLFLDSVM